ncbi:hypothetical protein CspHIS471_0203240 [Cutaneotrichosporon sp. HIS471]|nr:hypothetical protein CspHIS471_0203240 [Cutaneotrichosporon sp. HIS471]
MSNDTTPLIPGLPAVEPPPPDATAERCHLLGPTALVVQAIMGVLVLSSLVVKRHLEKRKRPWRVWGFDVGKQLVGQATLHACNILVSMAAGNSSSNNPCSLYFLNILIDTTIGVGIFYLGLIGYTKLFVEHFGPEGFTSGQYGRPPQWHFWFRQLQPYLAAVVTMKLIVILMLTLPGISGALIRGTQSMLGYLSLDVQVVFVLAIFPVIMNVFQFCVMDQVIKAGKGVEHKEQRDQDEEEMDGYEPVRTREHTGRSSGAALSRSSSRVIQMGSLEFAPFVGQRTLAVGDNVHRVEMTSRSPTPPPAAASSGPRRVPLIRESPSPHPSTSSVASTSSEDSDADRSLVSSSASTEAEAKLNGAREMMPNGTPRKTVNGTAIVSAKSTPNGTPNGTPKKATKVGAQVNGEPKTKAGPQANSEPKTKAAPTEHTLADPSDVDLSWPQLAANRPPGLFNPSMACYSNATLQMLLHTAPLLNLVIAHDSRTCQLSNRNAFCMTCALRITAQEHWSGKKKAYTPQAVQGNLGRIKKGFSARRQEDAHEFLRFVTDGLQNSALAGLPKNLPEKVKCTSWVYRTLGGRVRSRVLCLSCKKPSDTFDSLLDLSLDIPSGAQDIQDLFDHYVHKERLDGENKYKCENCKKKSVATKQLLIAEAPPVLTLHLKRFGFNWQGQSKKIGKHIAFPSILDINPYMVDENAEGLRYRLSGVICHHGYGPHSGHYTAYVRSPDGKWFEADDEEVRQVPPQRARADHSAYVLNYVRLTPEEEAGFLAKREEKKAAASAEAPAASPPSIGKRQREDDGAPTSSAKRVMSAPRANGTPMSANGTPKASPVLKANTLNAPKANGTPTPSSLGKLQDGEEETPSSNTRIAATRADDTPKANGHMNGTPNGALARLANYDSSSENETDEPTPGPRPGSFDPTVPTSPKRSTPGSPKKRKHKNHHADPKRGLHGLSKGAPMPFARRPHAGQECQHAHQRHAEPEGQPQ